MLTGLDPTCDQVIGWDRGQTNLVGRSDVIEYAILVDIASTESRGRGYVDVVCSTCPEGAVSDYVTRRLNARV